MVANKGEVAVLLLDGEEVRGAKQNRILNTTILVGPKSTIKVPVSCVEHGRWSYQEREFAESGNVMHREMRALNVRKVNENLASVNQFRSDQGEIWDGVAKLACDMKVVSSTGAMRDVYEAKGADLDGYLKSFRLAQGQKGILVFVDGRPAGLDFVSRDEAFATLFPKLVKSYAMEAMLLGERRKKGRGKGDAAKALAKPSADQAREFLKKAAAADEKKYESIGLGWAYRYAGPEVVGIGARLQREGRPHGLLQRRRGGGSGPGSGRHGRQPDAPRLPRLRRDCSPFLFLRLRLPSALPRFGA